MDTNILEDLGLTNAEIKVYIALLGLGSSTAGPILKKTGLQNSVVHMTLQKLVGKGLVSFITKGKVKHYQSTDPKNIINFIDEKKRKFESILPELLSKQKPEEKQEAEIFEGFKGFKTMLHELIKDAEKDDEYLFFSFSTKNPVDFENVFNYYKEFEKERVKLGIKGRGVAPIEIKHLFSGRELKNIVFVDYPTPTNITIFRNKVIMTPWEDKQISFLIHSRQLANSFRELFYSIWEKEKGRN